MSSFVITVSRNDTGQAVNSLLRRARAISMQRQGHLTPAYRIFRERATGEDRRMTVAEFVGQTR